MRGRYPSYSPVSDLLHGVVVLVIEEATTLCQNDVEPASERLALIGLSEILGRRGVCRINGGGSDQEAQAMPASRCREVGAR